MARTGNCSSQPTSSFRAPMMGVASFSEDTPTHSHDSGSIPRSAWARHGVSGPVRTGSSVCGAARARHVSGPGVSGPARARHVSGGNGLRGSSSCCSLEARQRHASGGAVRRKDAPPTRLQPANDITQTDVVVIGNGPSGICMSYLLSGHWPYHNGQQHSDEALSYRLSQHPNISLVEQDLVYLSEGLEGRSSNPVALLFDALTSPDADLGLELPSLLEWRHDPTKIIPHVVLGRRAEGGIWQTVDGQMQTLSLGTWMQLPDYPFKKWLTNNRAAARFSDDQKSNPGSQNPLSNRASMSEVQQYYADYVTDKGLRPYFRNYTTVTSIHRLAPPTRPTTPSATSDLLQPSFEFTNHERSGSSESPPTSFELINHNRIGSSETLPTFEFTNHQRIDDESGERVACCSPEGSNEDEMGRRMSTCSLSDSSSPLWLVCGYETVPDIHSHDCDVHGHCCMNTRHRNRIVPFCYAAKSVVLATGAFERPNRLGVPGEDGLAPQGTSSAPQEDLDESPYVFHSFTDLEVQAEVDGIVLGAHSDPVVVVGAGLSAADAVISLLRASIPVVHVFRRDPSARRSPGGGFPAYRQLPANIYPEYAAVHRLMMGESIEQVWDGIIGSEGEGEEFIYEEGGIMVDRAGLYRAYPSSEIVEFTAGREVVLRSTDAVAMETVVKVTYAVVLIGSKPDLSFLPGNVLSRLGVVHGSKYIDPKHNPVDVDPWMYESRLFPGLYAMGPLVGDNFVRFLQGGALGITAHIWQRMSERSPTNIIDVNKAMETLEADCRSDGMTILPRRRRNKEEERKLCRIRRAIATLVGRSSGECCRTKQQHVASTDVSSLDASLLKGCDMAVVGRENEIGQGDRLQKVVSGPKHEAWHLL